jgi:methylglyoxal synthase
MVVNEIARSQRAVGFVSSEQSEVLIFLRYPLSEVIHMPGTLVRLSQQMLVML